MTERRAARALRGIHDHPFRAGRRRPLCGGWLGPFLPAWLQWIYFLIKVFLILFFYVWMRWTLPRYRYDQLMEFGWKWLLPAAVVNLLATAALVIWMG